MNNPKIIDCTLREGRQSLTKELTQYQILKIAEAIISLGIDQIEFGHAAKSKDEITILNKLKSLYPEISVLTHSRAKKLDVEKASESSTDWVGIFISANEYAQYKIRDFSINRVYELMHESIDTAKSNGLKVRFTLEDSSRTSNDILSDVYNRAIKYGADRICFSDTVGILEPKDTESKLNFIRKTIGQIPLETHFHDDRGLAMANALTSVDNGVEWLSSSVNGIGERSGITDTCLLLVNLHYRNSREFRSASEIIPTSTLISKITGYNIDSHRPLIGKKAFHHVADLHVKAIKKSKLTYNWIDPIF